MQELIKEKKKWEVLYEALVDKEYGDIIHHYDIERIIGEKRGRQKYYNIVGYCNTHLLVAGKKLEPIHGIGYRVIEPDFYTANAIKHYVRGAREMQKGQDTIEYAPTEYMSDSAYQEYTRIKDKAISISRMVSGGMVELKKVRRKQHPALEALRETTKN